LNGVRKHKLETSSDHYRFALAVTLEDWDNSPSFWAAHRDLVGDRTYGTELHRPMNIADHH
jgi:hypothetical protein